MKKDQKTKQLLTKTKKKLEDGEEKIKEQEKTIAGFVKATEAFDVQFKQRDDREKELLQNRSA